MTDSLGLCEGDAGFHPRADLNGDGCVNVLDVRWLNQHGAASNEPPGSRSKPGPTERIIVDSELEFVEAASVFSIPVKIRDNTTPLFGYSLEAAFLPQPGTIGSISAVVKLTNFYDKQNLITQGGATRDPEFSVIIDQGDGGVFISTNTDDGSTVLATDDVNDVLAEIFFTPAPGSSGEFVFDLGPASALSDGDGFSVPFELVPFTITAFPNPADVNLDGIVGFADILLILSGWGPCEDPCPPCPEDVSGNCIIDFADLLIVLSSWT